MSINSPLQVFRLQISQAIQELWAIALTSEQITSNQITPDQIRIDIAESHYAAHFSSSIAIAIAPQLHLEPLVIAERITEACQNPQMQAVGKGWLNLTLQEDFILENLHQLLIWQPDYLTQQRNLWRRNDLGTNSGLAPVIEHEYAYARCCALIRLATREKLDVFRLVNTQKFSFPPDYVDLAELELCLAILAIADDVLTDCQNLSPVTSKSAKLWRSRHARLSNKFLKFYDHCPIFGVSQAIALRRLILISITQKLFLAIAPADIDYAPYL